MGNGQYRNRRGARPRPAPHKHGGAGTPSRATTHLIPPVTAAGEASGDFTDELPHERAERMDLDETEDAGPSSIPPVASAMGDAPERQAEPESPLMDTEQVSGAPMKGHAGRAPHERVAPVVRGSAGRFYAPGQGPRQERTEGIERVDRAAYSERAERIASPPSPTPPAYSAPPSRRPERIERMERPAGANDLRDEDDGAEYSGPRGDVRGSVGPLVDSLRDLFVRDRSIASQGGVARCGVCYLHFPVGELTYREGEGFYVCSSCEHALGSARVSMVRRQQRQ